MKGILENLKFYLSQIYLIIRTQPKSSLEISHDYGNKQHSLRFHLWMGGLTVLSGQ